MSPILVKKVKNVGLHVDVLEEVERRWKEHIELRHENITLSTYINRLLMDRLEREHFIEVFLPNLELIAPSGNIMYIRDVNNNSVFRVCVENKTVKCIDEIEPNVICDHVLFTLSCPEFPRFFNNLNHDTHNHELPRLNIKRSKPILTRSD